ncbi:MAG: SIS domain-containing protein [Candidatus Limnocylindrales bacterium]
MTTDRVELFRADIAASPDAITRLLDTFEGPDLGGRRRFLFTGLGSSRFAAQLVAAQVQHHGGTAWVESAGTSAATPPAEGLVLFAISASGRTAEVIEAAAAHRGRSLVVAVTNDPASPLAANADAILPLQAGVEASGIAGRTFRATIAALVLATGLTTPDRLRPAVDGLAARLATVDAWSPPIVDGLDGAPAIDVLADAALIGLAEQAALMLREAPRLAARAYDTTDWLHTGVYLAWAGHRVLLYEGSAADAEVDATVLRRGALVQRVPAGAGEPLTRAIVDSIVAEVVAATLWERTASGSAAER